MTRSPTRSRVAFSALVALLFAASFAAAYMVRQRQNDEPLVVVDSTVVAETTLVAETTSPLVVDSSVPDTTVPPETTLAPETTEAPTTTVQGPRIDLALTTDGAVFAASTERRLWDDTIGCDSLGLRPGTAVDCDRIEIGGVGIAWVLDGGGGATVLQNDPGVDEPGTWNAQLDSSAAPTRRPLLTDVTGDGQPELLFGFRTDAGLAVDVIEIREGSAGVVLHLDLVGGRVTAGDGQIDVWQRRGGTFEHWTLTRDNGRWKKDGFEASDSAPNGNL